MYFIFIKLGLDKKVERPIKSIHLLNHVSNPGSQGGLSPSQLSLVRRWGTPGQVTNPSQSKVQELFDRNRKTFVRKLRLAHEENTHLWHSYFWWENITGTSNGASSCFFAVSDLSCMQKSKQTNKHFGFVNMNRRLLWAASCFCCFKHQGGYTVGLVCLFVCWIA